MARDSENRCHRQIMLLLIYSLKLLCFFSGYAEPHHPIYHVKVHFLDFHPNSFPFLHTPSQNSVCVSLPIKVLKALIGPSRLPTFPTHLNLLDLVSLFTFGSPYIYASFHRYRTCAETTKQSCA